MTNQTAVAVKQLRLTREQLINAARKASPLLPVASQWLMNELASRFDVTSVALCESMEQRKTLAIENAVQVSAAFLLSTSNQVLGLQEMLSMLSG
ncbi:hypothetical protein [Kluyvera georgiana]|uniref:hypothetical protein n=1 Tax=Kluyvera georgiana TaxID=73098 RepID=UPI003AF180A1